MKTANALFVALGAALLSCGEGPLLREPSSTIRFALPAGEFSSDTRALSWSSEESLRRGGFNICVLRVDGSLYYEDKAVWNASDRCFDTESVNYWPVAEPLSFFACFPGGENFRHSAEGPVLEYSQDEPEDIMAASAFRVWGRRTVELGFRHLLSRVRISTACETAGPDYRITELKAAVPSYGTYSFLDGLWTAGPSAEYALEGDEMLFIPGELTLHVSWEYIQAGMVIGRRSDSLSIFLDSGVLGNVRLIVPSPAGGKLGFTVDVAPWEDVDADPFERFFEGTADGDFKVSIATSTSNVVLSSVVVSPDEQGRFGVFLPELPDGCHYIFNGGRSEENLNLTSVTQLPYVLSKDGTFESMFINCPSLVSVCGFVQDEGEALSMENMFLGCRKLERVPPLDMSSCRNACRMFYLCESLAEAPVSNTGQVTNFQAAFQSCASLRTLPPLDLASCRNCSNMFFSCSSLSSLDLGNTGSVTSFSMAFTGCTSLEGLNPLDLSSCTDCNSIFLNCWKLASAVLGNTGAVTTFNNAFRACRSLNSMALDLASCRNCSGMFYGCTAISAIDITDSGSVNTFHMAFTDCASLRSLSALDLSSCTDCNSFLLNCGSLDMVELRNTGQVTTFNNAFRACRALKSASLDLSSCRNCSGMFYGCASLVSLDIANSGGVNTFFMAFTDCQSLQTVSALDLASCTDCNSMFLNCSGLENLRLDNTGNVGTFYNCFSGCTALESISRIDFASCANYANMFFHCSSLRRCGGFENVGISLCAGNVTPGLEHTILDRDSVLAIFDGLQEMEGAAIRLSPVSYALLDGNDISIATSKGWTVLN